MINTKTISSAEPDPQEALKSAGSSAMMAMTVMVMGSWPLPLNHIPHVVRVELREAQNQSLQLEPM